MPASEIPLQSCNKLESCLNLVSIPSNVQITNIQFELSELTISKQSCNRVEGREKRCIRKKLNRTPKKLHHTPSNQPKPNQLKPNQPNRAKKIGPKQPAKVRGGSTTPIWAQVTPRNWLSQRAKGLQRPTIFSSLGKGCTFRSHQRWTHIKLTQDKLSMDQQR